MQMYMRGDGGRSVPVAGDWGNDGTGDAFMIALSLPDIPDALPVSLLDFTATAAANDVHINWATANEKNNDGFSVERSNDGISWKEIGYINSKAGNGNSQGNITYTYTDKNPADGKNLYRLKQTDLDGSYEYSPVRQVNFARKDLTSVSPNPAESYVTIKGLAGDEHIHIYDATGKLVWQQEARDNQAYISLEGFSKGAYTIHIDKAGNTTLHKFVKAK